MKKILFFLFLSFFIYCQGVFQDQRGNRVQGAGNVWNGYQNSINGAENRVVGNQNQIKGSNNIVRGNNNYVGQINPQDLAKLEQQMASRLQGRFGNIFARFRQSEKSSPIIQEKAPILKPKQKEQKVVKKKIVVNDKKQVKKENTVELKTVQPQENKLQSSSTKIYFAERNPPSNILFASYGKADIDISNSVSPYLPLSKQLKARLGQLTIRDLRFSSFLGVTQINKINDHF